MIYTLVITDKTNNGSDNSKILINKQYNSYPPLKLRIWSFCLERWQAIDQNEIREYEKDQREKGFSLPSHKKVNKSIEVFFKNHRHQYNLTVLETTRQGKTSRILDSKKGFNNRDLRILDVVKENQDSQPFPPSSSKKESKVSSLKSNAEDSNEILLTPMMCEIIEQALRFYKNSYSLTRILEKNDHPAADSAELRWKLIDDLAKQF